MKHVKRNSCVCHFSGQFSLWYEIYHRWGIRLWKPIRFYGIWRYLALTMLRVTPSNFEQLAMYKRPPRNWTRDYLKQIPQSVTWSREIQIWSPLPQPLGPRAVFKQKQISARVHNSIVARYQWIDCEFKCSYLSLFADFFPSDVDSLKERKT